MTDLSNKPISYTGSHPLELAYRALLARAEAAEEALDALKAGDAVGATITQFLGARPDLKITMTAVPWGENGLLEAPVILATIGDYLGHTFYTDYTERSTTVEAALRALSAQITQSIELIADPDEHWQYRNGEPMAPDAAAFLEYLRGVEQRLVAAEARVAALESQLAAQQWRPVTEDWPPYDESVPVRMRNGVIRWGYRRGDRWYLTGGQYASESVTHAYALPPAPQETE